MKEVLKDLDKAFENRIRLGIMSALMVNDFLDFNVLKDILGVTDGNLASHLKSLEKTCGVLKGWIHNFRNSVFSQKNQNYKQNMKYFC